MSRISFAANILKSATPRSILDIGCRDASLSGYFPDVEYHGADLFPGPRVTYVGDITQMEFGRTFDTVVALDVLEHLDALSATFDRIMGICERQLLISLPNTYDLKSRFNFVTKGRLNGKYVFAEEPPVDRHHWLMSRDEILRFAHAKAKKHEAKVQIFNLTYGSSGNRGLVASTGRLLSRTLPLSLTTETVFALFTK